MPKPRTIAPQRTQGAVLVLVELPRMHVCAATGLGPVSIWARIRLPCRTHRRRTQGLPVLILVELCNNRTRYGSSPSRVSLGSC
ncbi:hypothetical protein EXIGLDRAFT_283015 [Exidia glandulosa HHB12029]|uniref:Uncharacterized protein n=1 Tax=Exidia glandulosa HHB12029 TaxID=1314781 RepID=A0A165DI57_EXIGL|nr:hypothetical protein EXIGLDRAFT_283015 [Exidia glandulosa HHB12029]